MAQRQETAPKRQANQGEVACAADRDPGEASSCEQGDSHHQQQEERRQEGQQQQPARALCATSKKKRKKLLGRASAGNITSAEDLVACFQLGVPVAPLLHVSLARHRAEHRSLLHAKDVRDLILHAVAGGTPALSLKVGNQVALNGAVVLAVNGVPSPFRAGPMDTWEAAQLKQDSSSSSSSGGGQLLERFSESFRAQFPVGSDLRVCAPGDLRSLSDVLLYAPSDGSSLETDETAAEAAAVLKKRKAGSGGKNGKKRPRSSNGTASSSSAAGAREPHSPLPPPLHYVLTRKQMKANCYPVRPASAAAAAAALSADAAARVAAPAAAAAAAMEVLMSAKAEGGLIGAAEAEGALAALAVAGVPGYVGTQPHMCEPQAGATASATAALSGSASTGAPAAGVAVSGAAAHSGGELAGGEAGATAAAAVPGAGSRDTGGDGGSSDEGGGEAKQREEGGGADGGRRPRLFGLDCEMCQTCGGLELCRVTLVDENHSVLLDELVKPTNLITDHMTKWSGINSAMLLPVTTRLWQVQAQMLTLVDARDILVGHSLENDLRALKLVHERCIDTAVLYPHPRTGRKSSLRSLALEHLSRTIQNSDSGHSSVEDAAAALALAQLKRWEQVARGPRYGDATARQPVLSQVDGPVTFIGTTTDCRLHGSVGQVNAVVRDTLHAALTEATKQAKPFASRSSAVATLATKTTPASADADGSSDNESSAAVAIDLPPPGLVWAEVRASPVVMLRDHYRRVVPSVGDGAGGSGDGTTSAEELRVAAVRQQSELEAQVTAVKGALPKNTLLVVVAQADVSLPREMLRQKAACRDARTASVWTPQQQRVLDTILAEIRTGCAFLAIT